MKCRTNNPWAQNQRDRVKLKRRRHNGFCFNFQSFVNDRAQWSMILKLVSSFKLWTSLGLEASRTLVPRAGFEGHGVGVDPVEGSGRPGVHSWEVFLSAPYSKGDNTNEFIVLSRSSSTVAVCATRNKRAA